MQMKMTFDVPVKKCVEVSLAVLAILEEHDVKVDMTQPKSQPYEDTCKAVAEEPAEIICPNDNVCGWAGDIKDLKVNDSWQIGCPKCGRTISRNNYGISVYEFFELPIAEQVGYTLVDSDGAEYDIDVAWGVPFNSPTCETCEKTIVGEALYGTSDSREPKWCKEHYIQVNRTSRFVKKGVE
jgi:hypothetical protein